MPQSWNLFCLCCKQTDCFAIPLLKKHNRQTKIWPNEYFGQNFRHVFCAFLDI